MAVSSSSPPGRRYLGAREEDAQRTRNWFERSPDPQTLHFTYLSPPSPGSLTLIPPSTSPVDSTTSTLVISKSIVCRVYLHPSSHPSKTLCSPGARILDIQSRVSTIGTKYSNICTIIIYIGTNDIRAGPSSQAPSPPTTEESRGGPDPTQLAERLLSCHSDHLYHQL
ncbi:Hypothetical predicted protein [Scomber scombrus]|uniref:Uncharacterized protein n=1 Tax=Scomber scombrus TaxID=13677 RepID=A0AAV1PKA3_SCOSC